MLLTFVMVDGSALVLFPQVTEIKTVIDIVKSSFNKTSYGSKKEKMHDILLMKTYEIITKNAI